MSLCSNKKRCNKIQDTVRKHFNNHYAMSKHHWGQTTAAHSLSQTDQAENLKGKMWEFMDWYKECLLGKNKSHECRQRKTKNLIHYFLSAGRCSDIFWKAGFITCNGFLKRQMPLLPTSLHHILLLSMMPYGTKYPFCHFASTPCWQGSIRSMKSLESTALQQLKTLLSK